MSSHLQSPSSVAQRFAPSVPSKGPGPGVGGGEWSTIGEVSSAYGVTLRALRFYESRGLLRPRREGCARYYGPRDRVRLELVLKGKRFGFSLAAITAMIGGAGADPAPGELALTADDVARRIEALEAQQRGVGAALAELRVRYGALAAGGAGEAGPSAAATLSAKGATKP